MRSASSATDLLEDDTDIRIIQAPPGHDKLDNTTARYTRVTSPPARLPGHPEPGSTGCRNRARSPGLASKDQLSA